MAADFQQQMQVLAQALERSVQIQEQNAAGYASLIQTLQASSTSTSTSGERRRDIKPLHSHYIYSAAPTESFSDHTERLRCIKGLRSKRR